MPINSVLLSCQSCEVVCLKSSHRLLAAPHLAWPGWSCSVQPVAIATSILLASCSSRKCCKEAQMSTVAKEVAGAPPLSLTEVGDGAVREPPGTAKSVTEYPLLVCSATARIWVTVTMCYMGQGKRRGDSSFSSFESYKNMPPTPQGKTGILLPTCAMVAGRCVRLYTQTTQC